jgi:hypothetical protein
MLKFIEKIGELLLLPQQGSLELRELKVEFVKNRKLIVNHLKMCKKSRGIIGLYATRLGKGMFLGSVTSIYHDVITLKPIGENDAEFKTIMLPINEITSVCPFNQLYVEAESEVEVANEEIAESQLMNTARLAHAVN